MELIVTEAYFGATYRSKASLNRFQIQNENLICEFLLAIII
jgi:hypothetical protein